jgi:hypothetical protein
VTHSNALHTLQFLLLLFILVIVIYILWNIYDGVLLFLIMSFLKQTKSFEIVISLAHYLSKQPLGALKIKLKSKYLKHTLDAV